MKSKKVETSCSVGDLVRIDDPGIIESLVEVNPSADGNIYGLAVELCEPDPDGNEGEDVWVVLISDSMWKMLRYEFETVR
jgi:hypothetical protein